MTNPPTFFFYDLETTGLNPREDRIMQFAGLRTDSELNPIGEPVNLLIKTPTDTLPSPTAIMVTKITPQSTQAEGLTEADFCRYLESEVFVPNTCAIGYNSIRFDDEFMRHLFWRNFRDPYEWQWRDGRSKWDLLDVVRLTRAIRSEGINWPTTPDGKATNRLELITKLNGIEHAHAHDALSDIEATIAVAKLIKTRQPQLYQYLFSMRGKKALQKMINLESKQPFVYASGRYSADYNKTTVAFPLTSGRNGNILVFNLRFNLDELLQDKEKSSNPTFFPIVKEFAYNKCPVVAPLGVLEHNDGWQKIQLSSDIIAKNLKSLLSHPEFAEKIREQYERTPEWPPAVDSESALYDSFLPDADRIYCSVVRNADAEKLANFSPMFTDERLPDLLIHYKAKNHPTSLTADESAKWEQYRLARLSRQAPKFLEDLKKLQQLSLKNQPLPNGTPVDDFILEELYLWYQSLSPDDYA